MATLVLTVIGDDRAGLVNNVAQVVHDHGGSWQHSEMAELGGKFAGVVEIGVPVTQQADLVAALEPLDGLTVAVEAAEPAAADAGEVHALHLLGNDRPGIVQEITGTLSRAGVSIDRLTTQAREAPMAGGQLFEATAQLRLSADMDATALRRDLEELAGELMVDLTWGEPGTPAPWE